jgi:hypothetical protein
VPKATRSRCPTRCTGHTGPKVRPVRIKRNPTTHKSNNFRVRALFQMDRKQLVGNVLAKADKYRNFTRWISDGETVQRVLALAEKLRRRAGALAKPSKNRIRRRAREIWEENGRPSGRDEEFWFEAEREFREAENLTKENQ